MYFFYSVDNANMFTETLRNGLYTQVHQNFNSQVITCVSLGLIVCYNTRVPNAKSFFVFRVVRYSSITVLYSERFGKCFVIIVLFLTCLYNLAESHDEELYLIARF